MGRRRAWDLGQKKNKHVEGERNEFTFFVAQA
jgi:hypothetical protein